MIVNDDEDKKIVHIYNRIFELVKNEYEYSIRDVIFIS